MQIFDIWDYYLCFFYLLVAGHAVILDIEYYIKAKKYDMNNGGIILNGNKDDTGLEKYVANTLGPFSWVSVRRR